MRAIPLKSPTRTYLAVFSGLLALTALTVGIAFVDLGGLNNVAAMTIAVGKAGLVTAFFMHAIHATRLAQVTIAAGGVWLAILIALTISDFATRGW